MNFLYKIYFYLPNFSALGIPGKIVNRVLALCLKGVLDFIVPSYFRRTASKQGSGLNNRTRSEIYIASLTSFPARINDIWITIETLLRQSIKPDQLILWLAEDQFPDKVLPDSLTRLQDRGLTISFCDDLRSHKKYYYSMIEFPTANIITFDDDLYFHKDVIKNLIQMHEQYPGLVVTNRAHKMSFNEGAINPYRKWQHEVNDSLPSHLLVATGGAGTLYPPGSLSTEAFNKDLIKRLCFHADDLWLKIMELKNGKMVCTNSSYNKSFVSVKNSQDEKLVLINVKQGGNDDQLNNLINYFGKDLIKSLSYRI